MLHYDRGIIDYVREYVSYDASIHNLYIATLSSYHERSLYTELQSINIARRYIKYVSSQLSYILSYIT